MTELGKPGSLGNGVSDAFADGKKGPQKKKSQNPVAEAL